MGERLRNTSNKTRALMVGGALAVGLIGSEVVLDEPYSFRGNESDEVVDKGTPQEIYANGKLGLPLDTTDKERGFKFSLDGKRVQVQCPKDAEATWSDEFILTSNEDSTVLQAVMERTVTKIDVVTNADGEEVSRDVTYPEGKEPNLTYDVTSSDDVAALVKKVATMEKAVCDLPDEAQQAQG